MRDPEQSSDQRIRRMAHRQGFDLSKSRVRDPRALDYGTVRIVRREVPGRRWRAGELVAELDSMGAAEAWLLADDDERAGLTRRR